MIRTVLFKLYFMLVTLILCFAFIPFLILPKRFTLYGACMWTWLIINGLRYIAGIKSELRGLEYIEKRPVIIASQHQSMWETLMLYSIFKQPNFVLKKELTQIPLFGWYLKHADNIPVKRGGGASVLKSMLAHVKDRLNKGRIILIFPHGTRLKPGETKKLEPGIAAIYKTLTSHEGISVVPATLDSGAHWPKKGRMTPGTITWHFHEPIPPNLDKKVFMQKLDAILNAPSE